MQPQLPRRAMSALSSWRSAWYSTSSKHAPGQATWRWKPRRLAAVNLPMDCFGADSGCGGFAAKANSHSKKRGDDRVIAVRRSAELRLSSFWLVRSSVPRCGGQCLGGGLFFLRPWVGFAFRFFMRCLIMGVRSIKALHCMAESAVLVAVF